MARVASIRSGRRPSRFVRSGVLLSCAIVLGGCGEIFGIACTSELRFNLVVEVRDSVTGRPAALGSTGLAEHESGRATELGPGLDSLTLHGHWAREQKGEYTVTVRKPGFKPMFVRTEVEAGACHIETQTVRVSLVPEPVSVAESPIRFTASSHVRGYDASAGVQVFGDTLVVSGRAYAPCTELTPVAYRTGTELHLQLEPAQWFLGHCSESSRLQQFEARYRLPAGTTHLYVTNGWDRPTVLFNGAVAPT